MIPPTTPQRSLQDCGIEIDIITGDIPREREVIIKENIGHVEATELALKTVQELRSKGILDPVRIKVVSDTLRSVVRVVL